MGFWKDSRNLFGKRAVAENALGRLYIPLGNMFDGEPVVAVAEEVVAQTARMGAEGGAEACQGALTQKRPLSGGGAP